jgi:hypothetical protein
MALLSGFAGVYTEVILIKSLHLPFEVSLMAVCFNALPNFYLCTVDFFSLIEYIKTGWNILPKICLKFESFLYQVQNI